MAATSSDPGVTIGRFIQPGAASFYSEQQYCLVNKDRLLESDLGSLMDVWELDPPNLVIYLDSSPAPHPQKLLYTEAMENKMLLDIVKDAQSAMQMFAAADSEVGKARQAADQSQMVAILGDRLYQRTIAMTVALVDACAATSSWLVLDWGEENTLFGWFLAEGLMRTASRPTVVVIDRYDLDRNKDNKVKQDTWEELRKRATPMMSVHDKDTLPIIAVASDIFVGDLWPKNNIYKWNDEDYSRNHPWGKWSFPYGTHYIFGRRSRSVDLRVVGSSGSVYCSGGPYSSQDILLSLQQGRPTVLLKHSGRAADFWSFVLELVMQERLDTAEKVVERLRTNKILWRDAQNDLMGVSLLQDRFYAFINQVIDMQRDNQEQLRNCLVIVDIWKDSPEQFLQRLSACFSVTTGGSLEIGGSAAEDDVITGVLQQQVIVSRNAKAFCRHANCLTILGLILSFCATAFSVLCVLAEQRPQDHWAHEISNRPIWKSRNAIAIFIPAVAGLVMSVLSRFRYVEKAGALHVAGKQLESETYKFRTKAGIYAAVRPMPKKSKKKSRQESKQGESSVACPARKARELYVMRTSAIFGSVVSGELNDTALNRQDTRKAVEEKQKRAYSKSHRRSEDRMAKGALKKIGPANVNDGADPLLAVEEGDDDQRSRVNSDDLLGPLSGESFFMHRLLPQLEAFQELAPRLSRRLTIYELVVLISVFMGSVLAACNQKMLTPLALALSSMLSALQKYEALQSQLTAVNCAIKDLMAIETRWRSLALMEKRTPAVKTMIVDVTEAAVMNVAMAYGQAASRVNFEAMANSEEEDQTASEDRKKK